MTAGGVSISLLLSICIVQSRFFITAFLILYRSELTLSSFMFSIDQDIRLLPSFMFSIDQDMRLLPSFMFSIDQDMHLFPSF